MIFSDGFGWLKREKTGFYMNLFCFWMILGGRNVKKTGFYMNNFCSDMFGWHEAH